MIEFDFIDDHGPGLYEGPTLYKLDSLGKLRTWRMQITGEGHYRTLSGLADGKQAVSAWTCPEPKSRDTVKDQGEFEVRAQYKHQLDREYHLTPDTVSTPNFFKPMLAKPYETFVLPCWSQPKLDGIRCIARAEGLFSRQGQPIVAVPHIHDALTPLFDDDPDLILDGELYNHEFREDFGEISSIVRKKNPTDEQLQKAAELMQYHVYDLPSQPGGFADRFLALAGVISRADPAIHLVDTAEIRDKHHLDTIYGVYLEAGYEGQIVRLDGDYEQKRSKLLLKRKEFQDEEFECVQIEAGKGNWAGLAKRVICRLPDGREFGAGIKGNAARAAELLNEKHNVVTVKYFQLTPDGIPRFPVVTKFHGEARVN